MTFNLKKSDLAGASASLAWEAGSIKIPTAMKALEKSAYQVLGRMAEVYITMDFGDNINKKDVGTAAVAFIDQAARKRSSMRKAAMEGLKEGIASAVGRYGLSAVGVDDGDLL